MNKNITKKECDICHKTFPVDPRVIKRQHVCDKLQCKLKHKRRYNKQWRARKENIDYFKGRYQNLKQWLKQHPGYLKNYREQKKNASKQKSSDIQVEITPINNNDLSIDAVEIINDIQVEITTNINKGKRRLIKLIADIQVE